MKRCDRPSDFRSGVITCDGKADAGAYLLYLHLASPLELRVGQLGVAELGRGCYVYVGSARRGIEARVSRHRTLAASKSGRVRWHIDYLLVRPETRLVRCEAYPGRSECELSMEIARRRGIVAPILRFGASDCRSGCTAHLYRIPSAYIKAGGLQNQVALRIPRI